MPAGRPTRYKPEFADQARRAYERGACDEDLVKDLKIGLATLYRWRHEHPNFAEAARLGKAAADNRVELALYQRAIGFEYQAERPYMPAGATKPVIARYTRRVLADPRAALQWLRIRRPEIWREDRRQEDGGFIDRFQKAMRRVAEGRARDGDDA